jgi:hypothetical protein
MAALTLAVCAIDEARPSDAFGAAAVFPPWWSAQQSLAASTHAGPVTGLGALPFIVLLRASDPGLAARAHAAGALVLVDSARAGLCLR